MIISPADESTISRAENQVFKADSDIRERRAERHWAHRELSSASIKVRSPIIPTFPSILLDLDPPRKTREANLRIVGFGGAARVNIFWECDISAYFGHAAPMGKFPSLFSLFCSPPINRLFTNKCFLGWISGVKRFYHTGPFH